MSQLGVNEICKPERDVHSHLRTEVGPLEEESTNGETVDRENLVHTYPAAAEEHKRRKNSDFKKRFWCCVHFSRCLYPRYVFSTVCALGKLYPPFAFISHFLFLLIQIYIFAQIDICANIYPEKSVPVQNNSPFE